jgi:hypothetical protein
MGSRCADCQRRSAGKNHAESPRCAVPSRGNAACAVSVHR